jgi:leucyl-tRNA synthetase
MEFKDKQKTLFDRLSKLRENATPSELAFRLLLDKANIKYIFQKGFINGNFYCIVDFYLPKPYKIVIEIDGGYHSTPEQQRKDWARTKYLNERGFRVIRFKNEDVQNLTEETITNCLRTSIIKTNT